MADPLLERINRELAVLRLRTVPAEVHECFEHGVGYTDWAMPLTEEEIDARLNPEDHLEIDKT